MKKLFSFVCAMFVCSIMSVSATKTIYCKMEHSWWTADGAAVAAYVWEKGNSENNKNAAFPGERMTPVTGESGLWSIEIDDTKGYNTIIFVRVNGSGDVSNWGAQTEDLTLPTDENNLFTITTSTATWGNSGKCVGVWSVYDAGGEGGEGGGTDPDPDPTPDDPDPVTNDTVFFVNADNWSTVNCYAWNSSTNNTWPGAGMTKADYQLKGADVYFFVAEQGKYAECIFNYGGNQTGNLTWTAGKYYYNGAWKTRAELESDEPLSTVIQLHGDFKDQNWSTLDAFTYNDAKTEATFVVTELEAEKTYKFGLKFDGNYKANGATITASANSTNLGEGSGNMKLTTTIAGDYTFTYVLATEVLTVTYPSSTPAALTNTEVKNAAVKVIRNGQVLIVREGVTYNMMGQTIQ